MASDAVASTLAEALKLLVQFVNERHEDATEDDDVQALEDVAHVLGQMTGDGRRELKVLLGLDLCEMLGLDSPETEATQVRGVRVLHDYHCYPLWLFSDGEPIPDTVEPAALGLSASLAGRLNAWQSWGDSFINMGDPAHDSRPVTDEELTAFEREGRLLTRRVAEEFPGVQVWYRNDEHIE